MKNIIQNIHSNNSLRYRFIRSLNWVFFAYFFSQITRLLSNLILTRLLFPEAFGIMAIITVVLVGLEMFSDTGIRTAIQQSRNGDDLLFLNTAWTIAVVRGLVLWLLAGVLSYPISIFYDEPKLTEYIPVAALVLIVKGFTPTRCYTAHRNLNIGKLTLLEVLSEIFGMLFTILIVYLLPSIWSLIAGSIIIISIKNSLLYYLLPGEKDSFFIEKAHFRDLLDFGKWIQLSTVFGFTNRQADKIIFGRLTDLKTLGTYNIAFNLISIPVSVFGKITDSTLIPVFREKPPGRNNENYMQIRKLRMLFTSVILFGLFTLAAAGPTLIEWLYDERYQTAGIMMVIIGCALSTGVVTSWYGKAVIATGDSKNYFKIIAARGLSQLLMLSAGAITGGLVGALIGQGLSHMLSYPYIALCARNVGALDILHDALFMTIAILGSSALIYFYRVELQVLFT